MTQPSNSGNYVKKIIILNIAKNDFPLVIVFKTDSFVEILTLYTYKYTYIHT